MLFFGMAKIGDNFWFCKRNEINNFDLVLKIVELGCKLEIFIS